MMVSEREELVSPPPNTSFTHAPLQCLLVLWLNYPFPRGVTAVKFRDYALGLRLVSPLPEGE